MIFHNISQISQLLAVSICFCNMFLDLNFFYIEA